MAVISSSVFSSSRLSSKCHCSSGLRSSGSARDLFRLVVLLLVVCCCFVVGNSCSSVMVLKVKQ